jgi:hypothetical protein
MGTVLRNTCANGRVTNSQRLHLQKGCIVGDIGRAFQLAGGSDDVQVYVSIAWQEGTRRRLRTNKNMLIPL